jgi:hypothetical protein
VIILDQPSSARGGTGVPPPLPPSQPQDVSGLDSARTAPQADEVVEVGLDDVTIVEQPPNSRAARPGLPSMGTPTLRPGDIAQVVGQVSQTQRQQAQKRRPAEEPLPGQLPDLVGPGWPGYPEPTIRRRRPGAGPIAEP